MRRFWWIVPAMVAMTAGCGPKQDAAGPGANGGDEKLVIGMMPKLVGIEYFNATERGAKAAAQELGVELRYDGPSEADVQGQVQIIETWMADCDGIAVAPNDPDAIAPVLKDAQRAGVTVTTWDADAQEDARGFFVNMTTSEAIAKALLDLMAKNVGEDAKYIIVTGTLTAYNQNVWMREMEKYRKERYPNMTDLSPGEPKASGESQEEGTRVTTDVLAAYPDVQGIFAITSQALPGAAEAFRQAKASDRVFLTGLSTPNVMREYVKDGTVKEFVLWNAEDLGYLSIHVTAAAARGDLKPGAETFSAGKLGEVKIIGGDEVILGDPIVFNADNIDDYRF